MATYKSRFFRLSASDRGRIAWLTAASCLSAIVQFAVTPNPGISTWAGIGGNVLFLWCCATPTKAPDAWFGLLPYVWGFTAAFDGLELARALSGSGSPLLDTGLSTARLATLPWLAGPLLRFHRLPRHDGSVPIGKA